MRKMIYLGLTEWLKGLKDGDGQPLIRHIDLWNEQVEFIEQEEPFATPAVFIEFRPVQWATLGGTAQQADVPFRLHVVTTWQGSAKDGSPFRADALDRFDLLDRIDACLFRLAAPEAVPTTTTQNWWRTSATSPAAPCSSLGNGRLVVGCSEEFQLAVRLGYFPDYLRIGTGVDDVVEGLFTDAVLGPDVTAEYFAVRQPAVRVLVVDAHDVRHARCVAQPHYFLVYPFSHALFIAL